MQVLIFFLLSEGLPLQKSCVVNTHFIKKNRKHAAAKTTKWEKKHCKRKCWLLGLLFLGRWRSGLSCQVSRTLQTLCGGWRRGGRRGGLLVLSWRGPNNKIVFRNFILFLVIRFFFRLEGGQWRHVVLVQPPSKEALTNVGPFFGPEKCLCEYLKIKAMINVTFQVIDQLVNQRLLDIWVRFGAVISKSQRYGFEGKVTMSLFTVPKGSSWSRGDRGCVRNVSKNKHLPQLRRYRGERWHRRRRLSKFARRRAAEKWEKLLNQRKY